MAVPCTRAGAESPKSSTEQRALDSQAALGEAACELLSHLFPVTFTEAADLVCSATSGEFREGTDPKVRFQAECGPGREAMGMPCMPRWVFSGGAGLPCLLGLSVGISRSPLTGAEAPGHSFSP